MPKRRIKRGPATAEALDPTILSAVSDPVDDDGLVRRSFGITIRAVNEKARSADFIASSEALDAYDEIVVQDWDLKRYDMNPVVLWNHNRGAIFAGVEASLPIGFGTNVKVEGGQLLFTANFVTSEANPFAEKVWQGVRQGSLRAVSVGFEPHTITAEKIDDRQIYKLSNNELFEISVCPMGANPEAVAKSREKAMAQIKTKAARQFVPVSINGDDGGTLIPGTGITLGAHHITIIGSNKAAPATNTKETTMTIEEQKALEAQLAEANAKLGTATQKSAQLESEKSVLATKLADAGNALATAQTTLTTLNERCTTLETERAKHQKRADELTTQMVERDLEVLVGVKIAPTEKPGLVKLAALDAGLYQEQLTAIKSRPDMKMLGAPVVGTDPDPAPATVATPGSDDGGKEITASIQGFTSN